MRREVEVRYTDGVRWFVIVHETVDSFEIQLCDMLARSAAKRCRSGDISADAFGGTIARNVAEAYRP